MQIIFEDVEEESGQGPSFIDSAVGIFSLLNRFIKAIQKKKKKKTLSLNRSSTEGVAYDLQK